MKEIFICIFIAGVFMFYFEQIKQMILLAINALCGMYKSQKSQQHMLISRKIDTLNGISKTNIFKAAYADMQLAFKYSEGKKGLFAVKCTCVLLSLIGMLTSLHFRSYILMPVLGIGLALLPMWVSRLKSYKYATRLHAELSVTLSAVTSSYLRTENFVKAVEENLPTMKQPLKKAFDEFLSNYNNVDKSIVNGIKCMSFKIKHEVFTEWCNNLIICQGDKNHIPALLAILTSLDSEKRLYERLKTEIYKPLSDTLSLILILPVLFPVLNSFSSTSLDILLNSFIGQMLTCGLIISVLVALDKTIKYCNPQVKVR